MKPIALITGGSKGIGFELARCFALDGYDLVICSRNSDELQEAKELLTKETGRSVHVFVNDLSATGEPERLFRFTETNSLSITALVNNAGFGCSGPFLTNDLHTELSMIRLNIESLVVLSKLYLQKMVAANYGEIINISSTAAFQPGPLMAIYYASKSFVLSFTEALHEELSGTGVTVAAICPGPTDTSFQTRSKIDNTILIKSRIVKLMSARDVAKESFAAFRKKKRVIIPGAKNYLGVLLTKFMPRALIAKAIMALNKRR